jgi:hypothetical protein
LLAALAAATILSKRLSPRKESQHGLRRSLHIVAPAAKREKVLKELKRPVFSLLEGRALSEMCSYLSYDNVQDLLETKHLAHLSDGVIEDYAEKAE